MLLVTIANTLFSHENIYQFIIYNYIDIYITNSHLSLQCNISSWQNECDIAMRTSSQHSNGHCSFSDMPQSVHIYLELSGQVPIDDF